MSGELAKVENKNIEIVNPAMVQLAESQGMKQLVGQETNILPTDQEFRYALPLLGKIRTGIKGITQNNKEYPKAVDYFVLPDVLLNDAEFMEVLAKHNDDPAKPRTIPIWFPRDQIGENVRRSYDYYGKSRGLICRSYDHTSRIRVDPKTNEMRETKCPGINCPDWIAGRCLQINRIRFMLPDACGVGVWQLDTKSKNAGPGVLCEIAGIKQTSMGKLAGLDLFLTLEQRTFHIPQADSSGSKKTDSDGNVLMMQTNPWIVHVRAAHSMRTVQQAIKNAHESEGAIQDFDMQPEEDEPQEPIICDPATGEVIESEYSYPEPSTEEEPVDAECIPDGLSEELNDKVTAMLEKLGKPLRSPFIQHVLGRKADIADMHTDELLMLSEALEKKIKEMGL